MKDVIVYFAIGEKCLEEASESAKGAMQWMPHIPRVLFTNMATSDKVDTLFNSVHSISSEGNMKTQRMRCLGNIDADRAIYVDSDTIITGDCSDIFNLLDNFDFAAAHSPVAYDDKLDTIPDVFVQYNCGVMGFVISQEVKDFFQKWESVHMQLMQDMHVSGDETSFRAAMYESSLRIATLPAIYNFRIGSPNTLIAGQKVKIFHGRSPKREEIIQRVLENNQNALYAPSEMLEHVSCIIS